jgi:hypothetical protein
MRKQQMSPQFASRTQHLAGKEAFSLHRILGAFAGLALAGGVALAQGDTSPDKKELLQQKVAAIKESIAQNQASLRQYTWTAHLRSA